MGTLGGGFGVAAGLVAGMGISLRPRGGVVVVVALGAAGVLLAAWGLVPALRTAGSARRSTLLSGSVLGAGLGVGALLLAWPTGPPSLAVPDRPAAAEILTDAADDCPGCPGYHEITGLEVADTGELTEVHVHLAAPPAIGAGAWLWFEEEPTHPVLVELGSDGWRATVPEALPFGPSDLELGSKDEPALAIRIPGAPGPVAVVSPGGDRAPDEGYATVRDGATLADPPAEGFAAHLASAIATVQAGFPQLDEDQRDLALGILARQLATGTYRYELGFADRPQLTLVAEVSVRFPDLAQRIWADLDGELTLAQSLYVSADGITDCTWMTDGSVRCERDDTIELPITNILGMVGDPAAVQVERAPARRVLGQRVPCWRVTGTRRDGPPRGESCSTPEGVLAVNDNKRVGLLAVLLRHRPEVREGAFDPPEDP